MTTTEKKPHGNTKEPEDRFTHVVFVRCTAREKALWKAFAPKHKLSQWVRDAIAEKIANSN